jgi:hypothetical protein
MLTTMSVVVTVEYNARHLHFGQVMAQLLSTSSGAAPALGAARATFQLEHTSSVQAGLRRARAPGAIPRWLRHDAHDPNWRPE